MKIKLKAVAYYEVQKNSNGVLINVLYLYRYNIFLSRYNKLLSLITVIDRDLFQVQATVCQNHRRLHLDLLWAPLINLGILCTLQDIHTTMRRKMMKVCTGRFTNITYVCLLFSINLKGKFVIALSYSLSYIVLCFFCYSAWLYSIASIDSFVFSSRRRQRRETCTWGNLDL